MFKPYADSCDLAIPEPTIERPATGDCRTLSSNRGRGPAPGSRTPRLTDASYDQRPGTPSNGIRGFERPVVQTNAIGPTDFLQPMPRGAVEAGHLRHVRLQYTLVGGPACTAPNSRGWGWLHNYGYLTIADTLKPAQQLPSYNKASVDTGMILDRARKSMLRTLFGG